MSTITMTDLYQLTMSAGYFSHNINQRATFELYVRRLPKNRSFLVAAGLEQALDYLSHLKFEEKDIAYLKTLPIFQSIDPEFFKYLDNFCFTGDVWAMPEGTVFFPYEPVLRITAPLIEAQIVETFLLSLVNFQTSVASKAARISLACQSHQDVQFIDFGSRRAHGPEAGVLAARAAFIGGAMATSNVNAGQKYGLPVVGTAAHAWTMAFDSETQAFEAYKKVFPQHTTLLVDTYDTLQGVKRAIEVAGKQLKAVRLDSGDFLSLSLDVRALLDKAQLHETQIVVSGDMNEDKIKALLEQDAPIDRFGVGTELVTSIDAPSLGGVYKIVHQEQSDKDKYRVKLSPGKNSYPGIKQVYRQTDKDIICLESSPPAKGEPLLIQVMSKGKISASQPSLKDIQKHTQSEIKKLKCSLDKMSHEATLSADILNLFEHTKKEVLKKEIAHETE